LLPRLATQITTTSPRLPRKSTTFAQSILQKPLQNTTSTTPKKPAPNHQKTAGKGRGKRKVTWCGR
jgi:hypothetical protein